MGECKPDSGHGLPYNRYPALHVLVVVEALRLPLACDEENGGASLSLRGAIDS